MRTLKDGFTDAIRKLSLPKPVRVALIRFIRRWQQVYYDRMNAHLELYDELSGAKFADLYHRIMHYVYGALYWFCVCNAQYKKEG